MGQWVKLPLFFTRSADLSGGGQEADMDQSAVLADPGLPAEWLDYWQRRAPREWSLRAGPMLTFLEGLNSWEGFRSAVSVADAE